MCNCCYIDNTLLVGQIGDKQFQIISEQFINTLWTSVYTNC